MPFVNKEHRENIDFAIPGDRCYFYYKQMVDAWRTEPRWTTADTIYTEMVKQRHPIERFQVAKELAWQVFFNLHVMPYEIQKQAENGDI